MNREQQLMSALAKLIFRLHGQEVAIGETLARSGGMTGSAWQVLAAVLRDPLSVAEVAREIGVTRQSVQRIADLLVAGGLAEYQPNPRHRRAKLLSPTPAGREAVRRIAPAHAEYAARLAGEMGVNAMEDALAAIRRLSEALEALRLAEPRAGRRGQAAHPDRSTPAR